MTGLVRCAGCGVRGRWAAAGAVVSAESVLVAGFCSTSPLRAHGPWLGEGPPAPSGVGAGRAGLDAGVS